MDVIEGSATVLSVVTMKSEAEREFDSVYATLLSPAALPDIQKKAAEILAAKNPQYQTISPALAAYFASKANTHNRDMSFAKAKAYAKAMSDGDWKVNHQGIAFYADGRLADGQHRMAAQAYSGTGQTFLVTTNLADDVIDTVDNVKQRTAGDALQLLGVKDAKMKAPIAEKIMQYEFEVVQGKKLGKPAVPQTEKWVIAATDLMDDALSIARASRENITDATLSINEAAQFATLLLRANHSRDQVSAYLAAIQQGMSAYEDSPITLLSKKFIKANASEKRSDQMNGTVRLALLVKGFQLWSHGARVTKLDWKADKEPLPSPMATEAKAA